MAAVWAGLEPVFADIDPDTWCLSPAAAEAALTPATALVAPVHVFGNPADTDGFDDSAGAATWPSSTTRPTASAPGATARRSAARASPRCSAPHRPSCSSPARAAWSRPTTTSSPSASASVASTATRALRRRSSSGLNARLPEASALLGLEGLAAARRRGRAAQRLWRRAYREPARRLCRASPSSASARKTAARTRTSRCACAPPSSASRATSSPPASLPRASTRAPTTCRRCIA